MTPWHLNRTVANAKPLSLVPVWFTFALINLLGLTLARLFFTIWDSRLLFGDIDLPDICCYGFTIDLITLSVLFLPVAVLENITLFTHTQCRFKPLLKLYLLTITLITILGEMVTPFFITHFEHRPTFALIKSAMEFIFQSPLKLHQYKYLCLMLLSVTLAAYFLSLLFNALWQSCQNHSLSVTKARMLSSGAFLCLVIQLWYLPSVHSLELLFIQNKSLENAVVNTTLSLAQSWPF